VRLAKIIILCALVLALLSLSAQASVAFVQAIDSGNNSCGTGGNVSTCAMSITPTGSGHTFVIFAAHFTTSVSITSLTDSNGTPTALKTAQATGGTFGAMYYEANAATGAHTLTVNFNNAAWTDFAVVEYSGADTSSPIDSGGSASCTANGNTGSPACTIVTTGTNEMAVGFLIESNITITVGTGWTSRDTVDNSEVQEHAATTAGSYTNNTAATGSFAWIAVGTALVPAAAAPLVSALPLFWTQIDTVLHPANLFLDGFEKGTLATDGWTLDGGVSTYVTSPVFDGALAQNFQQASVAAYTNLKVTFPGVLEGQTLYGRLYFYLSSNDSAASFWLSSVIDDTANTCEYFMLRTDGQMEMDVITPTTASVITTMGSALTLEHWYRLEYKIPIMNTASQTVEMAIFDGASSSAISGGDKTIANMNTLFSGGTKMVQVDVGAINVQAEPASPPATVTIDDVALGTINWIGP
jgi:hypothetical protein